MAYTAIDDPEAYFQVKLYTGNSTNDTAITLDGDTNMQPDMVWVKCRSDSGYNPNTYDSVRVKPSESILCNPSAEPAVYGKEPKSPSSESALNISFKPLTESITL